MMKTRVDRWLAVAVILWAGRVATAADGPLRAEGPRCEYAVDPIGIDETVPRLSWTLADDASDANRGARQTAYQVAVASTEALLDAGKPDLWDSGRVASADTFGVEYRGKPLASRQGCVWRVRAWDGGGVAGPWGPTGRWEMGLLQRSDWQAKWVVADGPAVPGGELAIVSATYGADDGAGKDERDVTGVARQHVQDQVLELPVTNKVLGGDPALDKVKHLRVRYTVGGGPEVVATFDEKATAALPARPLAVLRRPFTVARPVVSARLYASALGLYALTINGHPVGDHVLAPDWTDYAKRVRYQAYDVTPLLRPGANAIAGTIANGWYAGHIGNGAFRRWGRHPSMVVQLELTLDDGTVERVCTDDHWTARPGPISATDFMLGEDYDARAELPDGGSDPATTAPATTGPGALSVPVTVRDDPTVPLCAQVSPPVRELMTLTPKSVAEPSPGHWLFDLGQNMVGVERLRLSAPAGTRVTVRVAEMLKPDGTIYTDNYRKATSIDTYVCRGGGAAEGWQPRFTFHGFRYVELTGLPGRPAADAVTGVVLGSDTPSTGAFACSDPRLNQLWSNIRWGQRGNFLSVPTDCPQRDERLGWMGDAQVFVGTAVYNADVAAFFTKWMVDVDDEQSAAGGFTNTSPEPNLNETGTPAWADAGVICPWTIYRTYGDRRELARHLPAMERWVDWCAAHTVDGVRSNHRGDDFGDWLSIKADTPKDLIGTAYFAHSADLVARTARAVGDDAAAAKYAAVFDRAREAFDGEFVSPRGRVVGETQASYALALAFDLLPDAVRAKAADRLAAQVKANGNHLSTGFLGVSYLLPTLADHGHPGTAYTLLTQDTFPSWLFSVKQGATTIWERWDGWTPDKGFQDAGMNSFNHYSLGSCGQWLYESVAGIAQPPADVGFARLQVRPTVGGGGLTSVDAHYDSIRGRIATGWHLADGKLTLTVTVPPNVTADVRVPTADPATVTESGRPAAAAPGVRPAPPEADAATFEVGSGTYVFAAAAPPALRR